MNILKKANEIVNERSEEKERMYGPFFETMNRATAIYNLLSPNQPMTTIGMYKAMIAMKLAREAYHHKEDNLLDACAYMGSMNDYMEDNLLDACAYMGSMNDYMEEGAKESAEDNDFAYFNKSIENCSDTELISFYVAFCNGADPENPQDQRDYAIFKEEVAKRNKKFQDIIAEIDSIL